MRKAKLPPHLQPDGPFLMPITSSIWQPIKICRLCYDFYDKFDLFNHNTRITRSTIIKPAVSHENLRKKGTSAYVTGERSAAQVPPGNQSEETANSDLHTIGESGTAKGSQGGPFLSTNPNAQVPGIHEVGSAEHSPDDMSDAAHSSEEPKRDEEGTPKCSQDGAQGTISTPVTSVREEASTAEDPESGTHSSTCEVKSTVP